MNKSGYFDRVRRARRLLAISYILSLLGLYYCVSGHDAAVSRSLTFSSYTQKVHAAARSCRRFLILLRSHAGIQKIESARRDASRKLAASQNLARTQMSEEEAAKIERLSRFLSRSGELIGRIKLLESQGRRAESAELYDKRLRPMVEQYVAASVKERLDNEAEGRLETRRRPARWLMGAAGFLFVAALLTFIFAAVWLRRLSAYAMRNLSALRRAAGALRSGNLEIGIEPERGDEFGSLCASLKALAARLDLAQRRQAGFGRLAEETSRTLNGIVFDVSEFAALANQKSALDLEDELRLRRIVERVGRCNLLLGRLCELAAGQKMLAEGTPDVARMVRDVESSLSGPRPGPRTV